MRHIWNFNMRDTTMWGIGAYFSACVAWLSSFTLHDTAAAVGICTAVITFGINWWYKHQEYKWRKKYGFHTRG